MATAIALVVCSGLAHSVWNLFTKSSSNKSVFLWLITVGGTIVFLPFLIHDIRNGIPAGSYLFLFLTLLFQMGYGYLLPIAYQRGDMSQTYPIMRGIGALLVPINSVLFLGEYVSWMGWLGIIVIVTGLFAINSTSLAGTNKKQLVYQMWPAFAVGLCITGYTLNDKILVQDISPFSLIVVGHIGTMLVLSPLVMASGKIKEEWKINWKRIAIGTLLSPGSYLLFLFAVRLGPVSHLAPIREISTVFGTLLGVLLLKETNGLRRLLYAGVITSGVITLGIWGGI